MGKTGFQNGTGYGQARFRAHGAQFTGLHPVRDLTPSATPVATAEHTTHAPGSRTPLKAQAKQGATSFTCTSEDGQTVFVEYPIIPRSYTASITVICAVPILAHPVLSIVAMLPSYDSINSSLYLKFRSLSSADEKCTKSE